MTSLAVVIKTTELDAVASRLLTVSGESIGRAALRGVNAVAQRTLDTSVSRMIARVNLTEGYVRDRMELEPANDPRNAEAKVIALRAGGRRKGIRGVNLRQYAAVQLMTPVRFNNSDRRIQRGDWGKNPRASDKWLRWKKRTGAAMLGIPVGMKQDGVSVEVVRGQRKTVGNNGLGGAFLQRMPNGELLVMRRVDRNGGKGKKGKIEALHSLSVWQLFRRTAAEIVPLVAEDLSKTLSEEVINEVEKAVLG